MKDNTRKEAIVAAIKEAFRLVVFSLPGVLIYVISNDAELSTIYGGTILTVLRGIDKYIHENRNINATGIVPF